MPQTTQPTSLHLALLQSAATWEDKPATHAAVESILQSSQLPPGSLLVLPEMFATGFSMNVDAIAEQNTGGPTHQFLSTLAIRQKIHILAGLVSRGPDGKGRNQAVLFSPAGKVVSIYSKIHPFSFGKETEHYAAGTEIVTFSLGGFTICPFICYDLRFPEIFRKAALEKNVNLFLVIAAWPLPRDAHWTTLLAARAIENQAFVAGVNHVGKDPKLSYFGKSRILDPQGRILAEAGSEPCVIQQTLDPQTAAAWRRDFPALRDAKSYP